MGRGRAKEFEAAAHQATRPHSGWTSDSDQSEALYLLYADLVAGRTRLSDLPAITSQDLELVSLAQQEVVMHVLMGNGEAAVTGLSDTENAGLMAAAKNRDADLFAAVVALVAQKLSVRRRAGDLLRDQLGVIRDALDGLTFDFRTTKGATLETLKNLRADLDARIAYVATSRRAGYRFREPPEKYGSRSNRKERPDQFFQRVYAEHVPRGLTQADIRKMDPAYYNVLHVWCSRHDRRMASLVPTTRLVRDS